jgi:predicted SprT family Zn-dependent metalloprotease
MNKKLKIVNTIHTYEATNGKQFDDEIDADEYQDKLDKGIIFECTNCKDDRKLFSRRGAPYNRQDRDYYCHVCEDNIWVEEITEIRPV